MPLTTQKSADFNHIRTFELKFRNWVLMNQIVHGFTACCATYGAYRVAGRSVYARIINYTSERRTKMLMYPIMIAFWFYALSYVDGHERLNVNHLCNARDINGKLMAEICFKVYP